jgi:1,4-dihydroxy-2-naphthoate octaprenyltransferase
MKSDRLTLVLLIGIAAARIYMAGPVVIDGLRLLVLARMYVALHPRRLAVLVRASAVGKS